MKLTPVANYVLVTQDEIGEQTTESGIVLPAKPKTLDIEGRIVAMGEDREKVLPEGTKEGDVIVFKHLAGTQIEHLKQKYLLVHMGNIIAVKN